MPRPRKDGTRPAITGPYSVNVCTRCTHTWYAMNPNQKPKCCPRCGSSYWDRPPVLASARTPADPPNPRWRTNKRPRQVCPVCYHYIAGGVAAILRRKQREEQIQGRELGGSVRDTAWPQPRNAQLNSAPRSKLKNPDGTMYQTPREKQLETYIVNRYKQVDAVGSVPFKQELEAALAVPDRLTPPPGIGGGRNDVGRRVEGVVQIGLVHRDNGDHHISDNAGIHNSGVVPVGQIPATLTPPPLLDPAEAERLRTLSHSLPKFIPPNWELDAAVADMQAEEARKQERREQRQARRLAEELEAELGTPEEVVEASVVESIESEGE